ncbi:N-acetylneuraminate synthase family protein [Romboutsia sedimentorum]|uniref:N-acetylneuraminate synthase family protein n=1 Tax=Romboutsia sedimentorum TaxID=1368474 RepID=A0ABT7E6Y6_9FIRM|nr:N-acetylneuraminate synthase family protein [Romboutsia sedimentorum]MDK2562693.1 N-acetylneuraminate synthase family protein [Romboutsia sedimentorum]
MNSFKIENIKVGINEVPLVIPEIGINHGGSLDVAMKMVDSAHRAGAKLIKHQTHIIDDEMSPQARNVIPGNSVKSIYEVMKECSLNECQEKELKRYVESKGMSFISTPFSRAAANRLEKFEVSAYKIGSGEMNNYPLIDHIASFGKPMIVSTGMNSIESIKKAVEILDKRQVKFALLHTTNLYPTPPNLVRLGAMVEMMNTFKGIPIGLSDHTINNNACIAAMGLGACIVERHFTDTMSREGNDIVCSMDEKKLTELLLAADEIAQMKGGNKLPLNEEQVTIDFAFSTVVTIKDIKAGEKFTRENIWVKRPGTGEIRAEFYEDVLGKIANSDIYDGVHLNKDMIR